MFKFQFWTEANSVNKTADLMVSPKKKAEFVRMMDKLDIRYDTMINNVQELIDGERLQYFASSNVQNYKTLDEINQYLAEMSQTFPDQVRVVRGGRTFQGRDITGVRLFAGPNKPRVLLEGGIHAREWIAPAALLYVVDQLLTSGDAKVRALADKFEFYVFPVINGDGYAYSHTNVRT